VSLTRKLLYGGGAFPWSPANMASVRTVAFYDAEASISLTDASGFASAWADRINPAYVASQATSASRPAIVAAHALTGRPVLQFDGVDDNLRLTPVPYPVTGNFSILIVGVQDALPADTATRFVVTTGVSQNNGLSTHRLVSNGVNRFRVTTGVGAGFSSAVNNSADMSNRFYAIARWDTTLALATLNGVDGTQAAAGPIVQTTRMTIGASSNTTPVSFWKGAISAVIWVSGQMSEQDEANFNAWAAVRLGMG
jgi:hypothetical protein